MIEAGDMLYRHKLADTLEKIAEGGADAFYRGELTDDIVQDIKDRGESGAQYQHDICDASQQKVPYVGQTCFEIWSKVACKILRTK